MNKLTGYQRFVLIRHWLNSDRALSRENYIKKVCQLKGIQYVPPSERDRPISKKLNR